MEFKIYPKEYVHYLNLAASKISENGEYITKLDSEVGDGDHWVNMNSGFSKLVSISDELSVMNYKEMFKKIGLTLMSTIGGSAGVLYGSAYMQASKIADNLEFIDDNSLLSILDAFLQGIMQRGNSTPGCKTMIDPLFSAIEEYKEALSDKNVKNAIDRLKYGAITGMNATKNMEAVKGRAYYREDKGVGHLDPGAVTMCFQIEVLADYILTLLN